MTDVTKRYTFVAYLNDTNCDSSKDLERLWFIYNTYGEPKGVFINSFCVSNNVPYTVFYELYKKTQKKAALFEVVGISASIEKEELCTTAIKDEPNPTPSPKGGIMITIKTREGLCIQKKGLDYQGLKTLVKKLEGLWWLTEWMICRYQRLHCSFKRKSNLLEK